MIFQDREDVADIDVDRCRKARGDAGGKRANAAPDQLAGAVVECAHGTGEPRALWDHVVGGAGMDLRDGHDRGMRRIGVAAHDRLHCLRERDGNDGRVVGLLRKRAVRTASGNANIKEIRPRHHRSAVERDPALRSFRRIMQRVDFVAREALEQSVSEHRTRAAQALLGGLENEHDRAVEIARPGQIARGAQQHSGMAVMAAPVKAPRVLRPIGKVRLLVHRQRIHVGPQPDAAPVIAATQHADDPGFADAAKHLDAPGRELFGDDARRALLFETDFRMGVEVAPDRHELIGKFENAGKRRHESSGYSPRTQREQSASACLQRRPRRH